MTAGSPGGGELVGRADERAAARRALAGIASSTSRSTPAVLAVTGDPGIGKTRLLSELRADAMARGHFVISGSATEFEQHLPFGALAESLDDWLRSGQPGSARFERQVTELLHDLGATSTQPPDPVGEPSGWLGPHRKTRAILEDIAVPHGLVVVLDDLHWADSALISLIGYLLRRPPRGRVVLALGYRPRQVDQRVREAIHGAAPGLVACIALGPLSAAESRRLIGPGLGRTTCESLIRDSGGNPLFLAALRKAIDLPQGPSPEADHDLPPAVHAALLSEIRGLPAPARTVLHAAAIAGDPFDYGLVATIAEVAEGDAVRVVDELVKRDLIRQVPALPRFHFRHPLLRRIVYTAIAAGWRRDAHRRAAAFLARNGTAPVTRAHHVAHSAAVGDVPASALLADAARSTLWRAPATSAWLLTESMRLLPDNPATAADRRERTLMLARALLLTGRLRDGRRVAHTLLAELADRQPAARAEAATITATIDRFLGRHREARAVLQSELQRLASDEDAVAATIRLELITGELVAGNFAPDQTNIREAITAAERTGDRSLIATVAAVNAYASYATGRYAEALAQLDAATLQVDALPDAELTLRLDAAVWLGWAEVFLERFELAIHHFERALALIRTTGQGHLLTYVTAGISHAHAHLGRFRQAAEWACDAAEAADLSGSDELRTMANTVQCHAALHLGDLRTALDAGARAVGAAGGVSVWWAAAAAGNFLAQARLAAGEDPTLCREQMLRAGGGPGLASMDPGNRPYSYETLVHTELARGDTAAALAWVDRIDHAVSELGPSARCRAGLAQLLRAEVLQADGRPGPSAQHALRAIDLFAAVNAQFFLGRAHLAAGSALTAAGERKRGLTHSRRAQAIFAEIGAHRNVDQAVRAQRRGGRRAVRPGSSRSANPRPDVSTLTRRETEVARLVATGHTNRQIAKQLLLSHRTVETHVRHICTKLDAPSRTAIAVAIANHDANQ